MYPDPLSTSPISGAPRLSTSAPHWLWGSSNLQRDEHGRLVVGYTGSISYRSDDCASHMCISQDSHDQFFGQYQQNVNQSGSHTRSSQTLRATSPVLLSTSRCSQTPLELSRVLSDSARAFSGAPESTCSYGGAFRIPRDLTCTIGKFWSYWDLCGDLWETSREAETAAEHCGRLGAVFSQEWFLHNHKAFCLIIFVFVTVTRFATS